MNLFFEILIAIMVAMTIATAIGWIWLLIDERRWERRVPAEEESSASQSG